MKAAGVLLAAGPKQTGWEYGTVVKDPDGRSVELNQKQQYSIPKRGVSTKRARYAVSLRYGISRLIQLMQECYSITSDLTTLTNQ
jgi:hypothetical protein